MIIQQLITSFIASVGFGVIFNVPKKMVLKCGFIGMLGWILYYVLIDQKMNNIFATFVGAFFVAAVSHIFAKVYKTPVIIFSVSGIIPLVPGGIAYDAMRHVVENNYNGAIELAARAFMLSGAIAIGLVFSEVINQIINKIRAQSH